MTAFSTHPWILYDSLFERGTVTASSTASGYSASNVTDRNIFSSWKATSSADQTITVDLGAGNTEDMNALAITGHNFATIDCDLNIENSVDGVTWGGTSVGGIVWRNQTFVLERAGPVGSRRYWRIEITNNSAAPVVSCLALGNLLRMTEHMTVGWDPDALDLTVTTSMSRNGMYRGAVVGSVVRRATLKFGSAGIDANALGATSRADGISWHNFFRTCVQPGRPFWMSWQPWYHDVVAATWPDMWMCWPVKNWKMTAPIRSPERAGLSFSFDVLVEGMQA